MCPALPADPNDRKHAKDKDISPTYLVTFSYHTNDTYLVEGPQYQMLKLKISKVHTTGVINSLN